MDSLRNLAAEPDPKTTEGEAPTFWSLLGDPDAADEKPAEAPPIGKDAFDGESFFWAMHNLPVEEAVKHMLICGCVGSGKTVTIQLYLQSIAPRFLPTWKNPEQLILFDAKNDAVELINAIGLGPEATNVWILNPADPNSAIWDIAEEMQSPSLARHFATLLIPEERNTNAPYFTDGARELIYAVILGLNAVAKKDWDFRDLLCALESIKRITAISAQHPRATVLVERLLADEKHAPGIMSTLGSKLGRYEQVAALWHAAKKRKRPPFSISEFLKKPGVLILGNDPVLRDSFWPINAIFLKAMTQQILREPNTLNLRPRHWFVLDEFRAMESVQCIADLLNRGRSKGASVLIGLQSIEGLMEMYGEKGASEILGQCASKTFLRAGGPETGDWASRLFGKVRSKEIRVSKSKGSSGSSTSTEDTITERDMFLSSYFMNLPLPRSGGTYAAVCDVPFLDHFLVINHPFDEVLSWRKKISPAKNPEMPNPEDETLVPWTSSEEDSFCIVRSSTVEQRKALTTPLEPLQIDVLPDKKAFEKRWGSNGQSIPDHFE